MLVFQQLSMADSPKPEGCAGPQGSVTAGSNAPWGLARELAQHVALSAGWLRALVSTSSLNVRFPLYFSLQSTLPLIMALHFPHDC